MADAPADQTLYNAAPQYTPIAVTDLKEGETKYWCRCGLSRKQPWCDGSHKGTGITPLKWTVEKTQDTHYICACKQTKTPPFCDGNHVKAKEIADVRQKNFMSKDDHKADCKLCTGCGWFPDF